MTNETILKKVIEKLSDSEKYSYDKNIKEFNEGWIFDGKREINYKKILGIKLINTDTRTWYGYSRGPDDGPKGSITSGPSEGMWHTWLATYWDKKDKKIKKATIEGSYLVSALTDFQFEIRTFRKLNT